MRSLKCGHTTSRLSDSYITLYQIYQIKREKQLGKQSIEIKILKSSQDYYKWTISSAFFFFAGN